MSTSFYVWTIGLMLLGTITHVLKKVVETRKTDTSFSMKKYLTLYPYKTMLTVMAGLGAYLGLLSTDELSYVTAFMGGFMANSLGGVSAEDARK